MIQRFGGNEAAQQWRKLEERMKPLQQGAALFPASALRNDAGTSLLEGLGAVFSQR